MTFRGDNLATINEIKTAYRELQNIQGNNEVDLINASFRMEKLLLSSSELDVLDLHYQLMRGSEVGRARFVLRKAFVSRPGIEGYLLDKLKSEEDLLCIADVIHILGRQRSSSAVNLARFYVNRDSEYLKEICLYVLGWVGDESDFPLLEANLLNSQAVKLRITAGSAFRQIYWRNAELKLKILNALKTAFYAESNPVVRGRVVELIGSIAVKNLGLRESRDDPDVLLGDYEKALVKTDQYLRSL